MAANALPPTIEKQQPGTPVLADGAWPWIPLADLDTLPVADKQVIQGPMETSQQIILAATRGTGKTWHAVEWANAIAHGEKFGEWDCHLQRKSLFMQFDMPVHSAIKRQKLSIEAGIIYHPDLLYLTRWQLKQAGTTIPRLSDPEHHQKIIDTLLASECDIFWFDTLRKAQPPGQGQASNTWHPAYWESSEPVRSALVDEGKTLVFLHHANDDGSSKDTGAIEDDVDLVLLYRDTGDGIGEGVSFRMEYSKNRDGIDNMPINWEIEKGHWRSWTEEGTHQKIWDEHQAGATQTDLAERYKMHRNSIAKIIRKERRRIRETHAP